MIALAAASVAAVDSRFVSTLLVYDVTTTSRGVPWPVFRRFGLSITVVQRSLVCETTTSRHCHPQMSSATGDGGCEHDTSPTAKYGEDSHDDDLFRARVRPHTAELCHTALVFQVRSSNATRQARLRHNFIRRQLPTSRLDMIFAEDSAQIHIHPRGPSEFTRPPRCRWLRAVQHRRNPSSRSPRTPVSASSIAVPQVSEFGVIALSLSSAALATAHCADHACTACAAHSAAANANPPGAGRSLYRTVPDQTGLSSPQDEDNSASFADVVGLFGDERCCVFPFRGYAVMQTISGLLSITSKG